MNNVALVSTLLSRDETIMELRAELSRVRRSRNYWEEKSSDLTAMCASARDDCVAIADQANYRPGLRNMSLFGGYSVALARSRTAASASATITLVAGDSVRGGFTDHHIVSKYEARACVAQRLISRGSGIQMG
eukprot:1235093-Pyramimonas_sp.AAC.1